MIKVFFPPGCYGTYVTQCLYNYTNLRKGSLEDFKFDSGGSSHNHRTNRHARSVIQQGHKDDLSIVESDSVVIVYPCTHHKLDYYNNQFFKQSKGQLVEYVLSQITQDEADHKLRTQWNYSGKFDETVPRWILREWCSFWISNVLDKAYDSTTYSVLPYTATLCTVDIFENYIETLTRIVMSLKLELVVDTETIQKQHQEFLRLQKYHNSQQRCTNYAHDLINNNHSDMIVNSIFDEAYIQHLLRQHNYELQCEDLDIFPKNTQHLKQLIYEISNHSNP